MKVTLPEPCHEDWNKMDSQEKGRFCGSCQKLVIDFSQMSDTEIVNYFKEYKSQNTCGHFKKSQVDRKLKEQETPRRKLYLKELAAACFAFFVASTDVKAQTGDVYFSEEDLLKMAHRRNSMEFEQEEQIAINGKIVNGKKNLSNATISIKGTEHKTFSLENGLFSIHIPNEIVQNQEFVTLVVEYEGLETKEIEVKTSPTNQFIEIDFAVNMEAIIEALSGQVRGIVLDFDEEITIKGTVTCDTGVLPSATVQIKGTQQGTLTDSAGNYSITVPKDAVLVFHFVGFTSKEITLEKIKNNESVDVILTEGDFLGELVIIRKWYSPRNIWYKVRNIFR